MTIVASFSSDAETARSRATRTHALARAFLLGGCRARRLARPRRPRGWRVAAFARRVLRLVPDAALLDGTAAGLLERHRAGMLPAMLARRPSGVSHRAEIFRPRAEPKGQARMGVR